MSYTIRHKLKILDWLCHLAKKNSENPFFLILRCPSLTKAAIFLRSKLAQR